MVDSGRAYTPTERPPIAAEPDPGPGPLCSIEDLTGYDLQAIRKQIGKPLIAALDENDEVGMYAFVWRAEARRDGSALSFDVVMDRPLSEILEAFAQANGSGVDPTVARSGDS